LTLEPLPFRQVMRGMLYIAIGLVIAIIWP
jgi:hypothetical protein